MPLTDPELDAIADAIVEVIKRTVDPLKAQIKALESRPLLKYAGTWRDGTCYPEGRLCTRDGSLWLSTEQTTRQPGTDGSGWRLIVKRGQA